MDCAYLQVVESPRTDAEIVAASLVDPDVFGELFVRHRAEVFAYLSRWVGRDDAGELTGEVFVKAFAIRSRYDSRWTSARPWLFAITTRIAGDHYRKTVVRRREASVAIGYLDREIDPADDVADAIVYEELRPVVLAALSRIRSGDRDVLLMSALGGLSMVEVAKPSAFRWGR